MDALAGSGNVTYVSLILFKNTTNTASPAEILLSYLVLRISGDKVSEY